MELRIRNVELVGFADYIIMNYSIKIIIHYSLRSETVCLLSFENAIWKPIPTFPIGKELKQQISSLKRKQMVSPFSLEGDGGGYLFPVDLSLPIVFAPMNRGNNMILQLSCKILFVSLQQ